MPRYKHLEIRAIKEAMEYLKTKRALLVSKHNKEPSHQELSAFDTNVFYPQRRKLREECSALGHDFTHNVNHISNTEHVGCIACGVTTRRPS